MIWILIGMTGTGKSTVAGVLAGQLGCATIDVDDLVEKRQSRSIREIFETDGEEHFRRLEADTLAEVIAEARPESELVVATGGGVVTTPVTRALLTTLRNDGHHTVVWLDARPETIRERLDTADRPLLAGADDDEVLRRLVTLSEQRNGWYRDCATFRVECDDLSPTSVAANILASVPTTTSDSTCDSASNPDRNRSVTGHA